MTYKMKGSGFYGKGNQSPVKEKDYLDKQQQQQRLASERIDLEEKQFQAGTRKNRREAKNMKNQTIMNLFSGSGS